MRKYWPGSFWSRNGFEQFEPRIGRDFYTIGDQAAQIHVNCIAHHCARLIDCLSPSVTTRKCRNRGVVPVFVRFKNDAIRVGHWTTLYHKRTTALAGGCVS